MEGGGGGGNRSCFTENKAALSHFTFLLGLELFNCFYDSSKSSRVFVKRICSIIYRELFLFCFDRCYFRDLLCVL